MNAIKILLVDDDEDDYLLTRDTLAAISTGDYQLDWASTFESGLEIMVKNEHQVCLLDYRLGALSGVDLFLAARALNFNRPVIFLTGHSDHEIDIEVMNAGAASYLIKAQLEPVLLERAIRYAVHQPRASIPRVGYPLATNDLEEGLWYWDLNSQKSYFCNHWLRMLGYHEGEIGNEPEEWLQRVHPDDLGLFKATLDAYIAGDISGCENEHRLRHKDGSFVWVLSRAKGVRDAHGKIVRLVGSVRDITGYKLLVNG